MTLDNLTKDVQTIAVVCNQWGDTGKGKFSDYFSANWADVTARGTGGDNAGHTVVVNGKERVFHILPAGIVNDSEGKKTILGNGMVINPKSLIQELDDLDSEGYSYNNLMISRDAHVIMPYHVLMDQSNKSQKNGGIGTTGKGIGPCYTDKIARKGITIADLYDKDKLVSKLKGVNSFNLANKIDVDQTINFLQPYAERIEPFVMDTVSEIHNFLAKGKKILVEGAQGLLLSIEHGTYPYVTSSDCSLNGTANGIGLSSKEIDLPLGIVKFPFMTRVGAGPFPTEFGGEESELHCADSSGCLESELKRYSISYEKSDSNKIKYNLQDGKINEMVNSSDPFVQGIGLRLAANEYGATTGRPRRIGWTDAVAAKYAVNINGMHMVLTKVDCLSESKEFRINTGYELNGEHFTNFSKDEKFLKNVKPVYKKYEGYGDVSEVTSYNNLPKSLCDSIDDFEKITSGLVSMVSVGPDRNQTIIKD